MEKLQTLKSTGMVTALTEQMDTQDIEEQGFEERLVKYEEVYLKAYDSIVAGQAQPDIDIVLQCAVKGSTRARQIPR